MAAQKAMQSDKTREFITYKIYVIQFLWVKLMAISGNSNINPKTSLNKIKKGVSCINQFTLFIILCIVLQKYWFINFFWRHIYRIYSLYYVYTICLQPSYRQQLSNKLCLSQIGDVIWLGLKSWSGDLMVFL